MIAPEPYRPVANRAVPIQVARRLIREQGKPDWQIREYPIRHSGEFWAWLLAWASLGQTPDPSNARIYQIALKQSWAVRLDPERPFHPCDSPMEVFVFFVNALLQTLGVGK